MSAVLDVLDGLSRVRSLNHMFTLATVHGRDRESEAISQLADTIDRELEVAQDLLRRFTTPRLDEVT